MDNEHPLPKKGDCEKEVEDFKKELHEKLKEKGELKEEVEDFKKELHDRLKEEGPRDKRKDNKDKSPEGIKPFTLEELRRELEGKEVQKKPQKPKKEKNQVLAAIQEERRRLAEEREKLAAEMKRKLDAEENKAKMEAKYKAEDEAKERMQSFSKNRRKWRTLERIKTYLLVGEVTFLAMFLIAFLVSEGASISPVYVPLEIPIFSVLIFLLVMKGQEYYFRFTKVRLSGTVQRKNIGVDHYKNLEIPNLVLSCFLMVLFFLPSTSGFIAYALTSGELPNQIAISGNFVTIVGLVCLASVVMSVAWLAFLYYYKKHKLDPEYAKIKEPFTVEDVFLITGSGLLLKHITKKAKSGMDDDILTAMLTAVKDFVKDSFSSREEGELDELQYGRLRILLEYSRKVYLAVVVAGQESNEFRPGMKKALRTINRKFGNVLVTWDGNPAKLDGVERYLDELASLS